MTSSFEFVVKIVADGSFFLETLPQQQLQQQQHVFLS